MLITTEQKVRAYLTSLRKDYEFETLEPFLKEAEEGLLTNLIGKDLLDALDTNTTPEYVKLKGMAEAVAVWNGYLDAFMSLTYNVSKSGVNRSTPKDTEVLRRWEVDAILADAASKADRAVESMMAYLEKKAGVFEAWTTSDEYKANYAYLIPTARALGAALPEVKSTHRLYLMLRNYFERTERQTVKVVMGPLYAELKQKLQNSTELTAEEAQALTYAREYVAAMAMVDALPFLRVQFAADGVRLLQTINNLHDQTAVTTEEIEMLRSELRTRAAQAHDELKTYLNATASETVLAGYFSSANYVAPGAKVWKAPENEGRKSFRF